MQATSDVSQSWTKSTLYQELQKILQGTRQSGTYKAERVITSPQGSKVQVQGTSSSVLNFCLANHPKVLESAKLALDSHGFGMASVRFICGTQDIHKELEKRIAEFHGTEDTIVFPSCFDANAGFFEAILGPEDAVISDELNHASIIDGIRLCKAQRLRYKHLDMEDLAGKLEQSRNARVRLIATDGVFSMDGDIAPMQEICKLADKYDAFVFVDECHSTGFLGKRGTGTAEHWNVSSDRIICINSTLGKALGGATGGFSTGKKIIVDVLRQKARPYLFSNTLAPSVASASITVFQILSSVEGQQLREKLWKNTVHFRTLMGQAGFDVRGGVNGPPIVPVMLGDAALASQMADEMLKESCKNTCSNISGSLDR
ncbi:glycine C-acetyltransferase [Galdieria sulphuraria]|uniref:Glycine C-acetyltransferase n=1 Tax=Galdieria sulphuraria TaxID=130081 RepID=M2Y4V5_GALSU|nr:glycine C-acetyltransferase [Galdieria sulphuraria]EME31003.1 glycine C-acetyltransferase [Galdieria sulphuraria]|eukprot:XP_005707523.1 glycine C-acetyltransferase [Galdieria sulphuraria]